MIIGDLVDRPVSTSTNVSLSQELPSRKHSRTRSFSQPDPFDPNPQIVGRVREASKTTNASQSTEAILQSINQHVEQSSDTIVPWSQLLPYIETLTPQDQHEFNHWCHIRALYEREYDRYRATGQLLPVSIESETHRTEKQISHKCNEITLTTCTYTTMPHGMAHTSTSTSYAVTDDDELVLPPSPPLVSQSINHSSYVFAPPFSSMFTYPSHPFSCPPSVIVQSIDRPLLDRLMKTCALSCDCGVARVRDALANQSIAHSNNGRSQQLHQPALDRSISHSEHSTTHHNTVTHTMAVASSSSSAQSPYPIEDRSRARTLPHANSNDSQAEVVSSSSDDEEDDEDVDM